MKTIFLSLILFFLYTILMAQAPQAFKYQAVVRDASGNILTNKNVSFRISILKSSLSGTTVYNEIHVKTTNLFGLAELEIGKGTSPYGSFTGINWGSDIFYVKVEVDTNGGISFQPIGTSQLLSVPYALYASYAKNVENNMDSDADSTNEIQTLMLNANQLSISRKGGNTVTFTNWDTNETDDVKLNGEQTISGNKTFTGTISVDNRNIINVANPVKNRDAANKAYVDTLITLLFEQSILKLKDYDGNLYNVKKIGSQIWTTENLKTTRYDDGTPISPATMQMGNPMLNQWLGVTFGVYAWYTFDEKYKDLYGGIYNWGAVNSGKLCPKGWHVPTDHDWTVLVNYLGGENIAGNLMKTTSDWYNGGNGTNSSGFSALPITGMSANGGGINAYGWGGFWWSSTSEDGGVTALCRGIIYDSGKIIRSSQLNGQGLCVRCIKDKNGQ